MLSAECKHSKQPVQVDGSKICTDCGEVVGDCSLVTDFGIHEEYETTRSKQSRNQFVSGIKTVTDLDNATIDVIQSYTLLFGIFSQKYIDDIKNMVIHHTNNAHLTQEDKTKEAYLAVRNKPLLALVCTYLIMRNEKMPYSLVQVAKKADKLDEYEKMKRMLSVVERTQQLNNWSLQSTYIEISAFIRRFHTESTTCNPHRYHADILDKALLLGKLCEKSWLDKGRRNEALAAACYILSKTYVTRKKVCKATMLRLSALSCIGFEQLKVRIKEISECFLQFSLKHAGWITNLNASNLNRYGEDILENSRKIIESSPSNNPSQISLPPSFVKQQDKRQDMINRIHNIKTTILPKLYSFQYGSLRAIVEDLKYDKIDMGIIKMLLGKEYRFGGEEYEPEFSTNVAGLDLEEEIKHGDKQPSFLDRVCETKF